MFLFYFLTGGFRSLLGLRGALAGMVLSWGCIWAVCIRSVSVERILVDFCNVIILQFLELIRIKNVLVMAILRAVNAYANLRVYHHDLVRVSQVS